MRNSGTWIADNIWLEMSSIDAMLETIRLQRQTADPVRAYHR